MLAELGRRCGAAAVDLVKHAPDPAIEAIVASWPSRFDTTRATNLGLTGDEGIGAVVQQHLAQAR
jgi:D-erythronate 2-dehydrogenase